ncbi:hypothetical protein [Patulibacter sp. SYSU D01012]|uniref:hypothetical protein n=1 Tax=Patulibacter sp. SYSU D01012 TaxID=2817381 RepID=UPI001B306B13|nr:hypothetical protein [Patulibacter sp. SYSU D01012]
MVSRSLLAGALTTAALAAVPLVGAAPAAAATKDCGTITARGVRVHVLVTAGSFRCSSSRSLYRKYFRVVSPKSTPRGVRTIRQAGTRFRCQATRTGSVPFACFGPGYKPTVAADPA